VDWSEIGKGSAACQNPPWRGEHDCFVWGFYYDNFSMFTAEYGIVPMLINSLGLSYHEKSLFVRKLSMIYSTMKEISEKESSKNAKSTD